MAERAVPSGPGGSPGPSEQTGVAVSRPKLVLGAVLVALGIVLWIVTSTTAYGLVSGLGALAILSAAEPWIEARRNRETS